MADELVYGAPRWDEWINSKMLEMQKSIDNVAVDSGWQSDGIILLNGTIDAEQAHGINRKIGYRIVSLKSGGHIISVRGAVIGTNVAAATINAPVKLLTLPASPIGKIDSKYATFGFDSQGYSLQVSFFDDGVTFYITGAPKDITTIPEGKWLYFYFTTIY